MVLDTVAAGLSTPTNSVTGIGVAVLSPTASYEVGQYFKELASKNANGELTSGQETAHIFAHGLLGSAVAAAGGNDALTASLSAGGAEAAAPIFSQYLYGKKPSDLTADEKGTISSITSLAASGIGASTGNIGSTVQSGQVAHNAVENNDFLLEVQFALKYPKIALQIGGIQDPSSILNPNISTIASTYQLNLLNPDELSKLGYARNDVLGEGGLGNALRHTLWQALITKSFGPDIAIEVGNAHESKRWNKL